MKRLLTVLLIATLIMNGCTHKRPAAESEPTILPETTEAMVSTAATEAEVPTESYSQPANDSETVDTIYSATTIPVEETSGTVDAFYSDTTVLEETEPPVTSPPREEPKETAHPATTEPAEEAENTSPTESPTQATSPPEEETTVPSQPVEETQPEPEFEISYWISFATTYAQSVGLNLDAAAVDCWDNPITAGAHCIYLERDITNRLNRYSKDEDITDVWVWAIDLGNGTYDLYIGYA